MSRRSKIQTSIQSAVEYWSRRIDEDEISTDWREADTHCWRCGCQRNLERCHIVPHTLGGTDEPSNIVLLCKRCHREGPNVTDPEIMWDWIRAYRVPFLETFWIIRGQKEYAFIYGKPLYREIQDICSRASVPLDTAQEQFDLLLGEVKLQRRHTFRSAVFQHGDNRRLIPHESQKARRFLWGCVSPGTGRAFADAPALVVVRSRQKKASASGGGLLK